MKYCSILCAFYLILTSISGLSQSPYPYETRNFSKQEYNAESQNWSIAEDQSGYIYVANHSGLLEFDGVEWSFFPSPGGTVIRSVAVGPDNRIYTSGYREIGYWQRDAMGSLIYQSLNPKAEPLFSQNEEFWNTVIIGDRIYFHSFSSVFIYDQKSFRVIRPGAFINSISDVRGILYAHVSGAGLFQIEDTLLKPYLVSPLLQENQVRFCLPYQDSAMIIGTTSEGVFIYEQNRFSPFPTGWQAYFTENQINRGIMSDSGHLIIGTLLDGISVFDGQGNFIQRINQSTGLQNNTVLGLHGDRDQNIWVSLDKGVDLITFQVDPSYELFEYEEIGAIYAAALFKEDLYLCTNQGVFYRPWKESVEENFRLIPGTQGQAWSCDLYDDQLLVSHNEGTFRIENHRATQISSIAGGFHLTRDPLHPGMLVQSTYSDIVFYEKQNGSWHHSYQLPDFNDLIRYIELDHLNNIWASHMHQGIYRLKLNDPHNRVLNIQYYGDSIFGKDYGIQVFSIENRIIFTTGEQIYTYNDLNDSIIPHQQLNDELGDYARAHRVVPAPDHHYWFIGASGIGLFRIFDSEIEQIREYPIGLFRDHLISGYENIFPLTATEGLLCLDNGYALLRADQPDLSGRIEDKLMSLKSIEISGRSGRVQRLPVEGGSIHIPFNKNSMTLEFAFPFFSVTPFTFQSYVEGLDAAWSQPADIPLFHYSRIPAGDYKIRIRAFNEWNRSSMEKQITLQVSPPWYASRMIMVLYALFLLLLILAGRYLLLRRIRLRERKIQEAKEKELIRLRNEKLDAELSHKSQELANSTMAFIKKNEFLLELKESLKRQKEDLGTRYPDKYYSNLVKKIDNNISCMDDWKVFEFHFEKAHEKFLHTLMTK